MPWGRHVYLKGGHLEARTVLIHDGEIFVALSAKRVATTNTHGTAAPLMRNVAGQHKVVDRCRQKPRLIHIPGSEGLAHGKAGITLASRRAKSDYSDSLLGRTKYAWASE